VTKATFEAVYSLGVVISFLLVLIPCWVTSDPGSGLFDGAPLIDRTLEIVIWGTAMAVGVALTWPASVPIMAILWLRR
jgi:hypothetical protein